MLPAVDRPMSGLTLNSVLISTCDVCTGYGWRVMCLCRKAADYTQQHHRVADKQLHPVLTLPSRITSYCCVSLTSISVHLVSIAEYHYSMPIALVVNGNSLAEYHYCD